MNCIDMNAWYSQVRQARPAGLRRLRPRSARVAQRLRAGDSRRAPHPRGARGARAAVISEDERCRRHPCARPDHAALVLPGHDSDFAELVSRRARGQEPGLVHQPIGSRNGAVFWSTTARTGTENRSRPPTATRPKPGAPRVHPAALGGAGREGAAARLRSARGAAAGRQGWRPLRAGAARRPGARSSASPCAPGLELGRVQVDVGLRDGERLAEAQLPLLWVVPDDADRAADLVGNIGLEVVSASAGIWRPRW